MSGYHIAQICKNGHVITSYANVDVSYREDYCSDCGSQTIMQCPNCNKSIKGSAIEYGYLGNYIAPSYCYTCGNPFPWTEDKLSTTQELLELDNVLSADELSYLTANLNSLLVDTPKTKLVATKLKLALTKISTVTASAIKDIIIDISSEAAKKIIMGE